MSKSEIWATGRYLPSCNVSIKAAGGFDAYSKSALGRILTYPKDQWPYLINYLKDGRLELNSNRAERSIKPFVIDRKNFLFANTPSGATNSAAIFSLIQTATKNGLAPYRRISAPVSFIIVV